MIPNVGPLELIVVLVIALVVLGPKKLPEVGSSLGRAMRDFKAGLDRDERQSERQNDATQVEPAGDDGDRRDPAPGAERELGAGSLDRPPP